MRATADNLKNQLRDAILEWDEERSGKLAQEILDTGTDPHEVIEDVIKPTADEVGQKFSEGEFFLPHLLLAGKALESAMNTLLAALPVADQEVRYCVVIGTVKGDIHTIGKNTVAMMLRTGGFDVYDLGVDIEAATFVQKAVERDADIIALSSLLTTTLPYQRDVIEELQFQGLRDRFKVLVGGGPATQEWADQIGADGYGKDAVEAVAVAKRVLDIHQVKTMKETRHEIVYLSTRDVDRAGANMSLAIECVEKVLSLHERNQVILPPKVILDMDERRHGRINAMPAYVGGDTQMCGIKWIAGFPNNPVRYGIPRANALIILNDAEKGLPMCIMEGTRISALRTGAVTGVGARYLARPNSQSLALIGAGAQAWTQLEAVLQILQRIGEARVFDVRREAAQSFRERSSERWPDLSVTITESPEQAVRGADVVVTATTADEPIVRAGWLKPGVFFAHVGSYQEEEEAVVVQADKVVVDIWKEVLHRGTPLLARMYRAGRIDDSRIHANIGQIINGDKPGRETDSERIFFSPLGLGSEDIAMATEVYRRAIAMGLGTRFPFGASI